MFPPGIKDPRQIPSMLDFSQNKNPVLSKSRRGRPPADKTGFSFRGAVRQLTGQDSFFVGPAGQLTRQDFIFAAGGHGWAQDRHRPSLRQGQF